MASPTGSDHKLSLMELPSMDDDGISSALSPVGRYTAVLTPDVTGTFSPKVPGLQLNRPPKIHIQLLSRKLAMYVLGTSVFLAVFTAVAYTGVMVYSRDIQIGDKDEAAKIDQKVELFNAISGFLVALVEVMLGVYMDNFLPAFQVYLHNSLWYMHSSATATKVSNKVRSVVMFLFPVFLMLIIGQCLRSFQAGQSSVGFKTIMSPKDLYVDVSVVDLVKKSVDEQESTAAEDAAKNNVTSSAPTRYGLGILTAAAEGSISQYENYRDTNCSRTRGRLHIAVDDLSSATVSYAFPVKEWYSEMLDLGVNTTYSYLYGSRLVKEVRRNGTTLQPPDFDLVQATDMYASAKIVLDRMVAETLTSYSECKDYQSDSLDDLMDKMDEADTFWDPTVNARVKCSGSHRTLVEIGKLQANPSNLTVENFIDLVSKTLSISADGLNTSRTNILFTRENITDQVQAETMNIYASIELNKTYTPFFTGEAVDDVYNYGEYSQSLCGSENCLFLDTNNKLELPRQIIMVPFQKNCKYSEDRIQYMRAVRSFVPTDCETEPNSALVITITSFIQAEWYGSDLSMSGYGKLSTTTPGLIKPYRRLAIAVSKISWKTSDLRKMLENDSKNTTTSSTTKDEVLCNAEKSNCNGLGYRLTKTGRYVFVREDKLPTAAIERASLGTPIKLVQLNPPRMYITGWKKGAGFGHIQITPDRLAWTDGYNVYDSWDWRKKLNDTQCSALIDTYSQYVDANGLFMDIYTAAPMYQAPMFYLFTNGAVTSLNDTIDSALRINSSSEKAIQLEKLISTNALDNIKLSGDTQYRSIRVRVPNGTFMATIVGCGVLLAITILVLVIPKSPMEYFAPSVTTADKFITLKNDEKYPDLIHKKTLLFPASGESLPMEDFDVDEMTLVNRTDTTDEIKIWDWSH